MQDYLERQKNVYNILSSLRGLDPLKKLFWTELNYDRENQPLSRRGWADAERDALADDPVVFASGGEENRFHVIYARLASDHLPQSLERPIVTRLLRDHQYALFNFSNQSQDRWHFLNVKYDPNDSKRRLFRRITVGPEERLRTASEQIADLDLETMPRDMFGLSPLAIQAKHDEAFNVEKVTKKFFEQYHLIFKGVEALVMGLPDDEATRLFTQRLFNRLMFIAFIQKKGWLKFGPDKDYLSALWAFYRHDTMPDKNFYRDRLKLLFSAGLNNHQEQDLMVINQGGVLKDWIGRVPYLNGGLFEEDDDEKNPDIFVPDECFKAILDQPDGLFNRFNFTVTESTPLDVEVAVDPEMLGKVFEKLVTGRHESGSYYTPKPIVTFMCREALKGYLKSQLPHESPTAIEAFVDEEHKPQGLRDPEGVLEALHRVKVCDPACGSGAYLLGMLHELLELWEAIYNVAKIDPPKVYARKLEIIKNNLYGVDKDEFAVNIARLRLWLSLSVDFEGDKPEPLPNLDYKLETGNSLTAPDPNGLVVARTKDQIGLSGGMRGQLINDLLDLKARYMTAHSGEKTRLKTEIGEIKRSIAEWSYGGNPVVGFDWQVEFAEVFAEGGFDIIVANPPYVRHEKITDPKPILQNVFPEVYTGVADLYAYFYARALQLLRPGGMLAFISSNKWFRANYGKKLRKHVADTCHVLSITDFGDLPVFESATAYPMVFIAQKGTSLNGATVHTQVESLESPYPDVLDIIREQGEVLPPDAMTGANWMLARADSSGHSRTMLALGVSLIDYVKGQIYYGIKTGFNNAFVLDDGKRLELIKRDPKSKEIIKPLLVGRDIKKWSSDQKGKWLIITKIGVDMKHYPAVFEHLKQWQDKLEKRWDKGNHWWELRTCAYYDAFEKPKIVFPDIAPEPRFAFDLNNMYLGNTAYIVPVNDLYLLGVLNSSHVASFYLELSAQVRGGYLRFIRQYVEQIPIPNASNADRSIIANLVQKCLDTKGVGCEEWEREIDERVARLYGLTMEDVSALPKPGGSPFKGDC